MVGCHIDITERKRSEEALRQSEERFRNIIEQAPIAMAVVGMDEKIEFINRKAIMVFGYLPEDIPTMDRWWIQAYPNEAYRNEVVADWTGRIKKALTGGGEIIGNEYQVTCRDGSVKTMFISGIPVQNKIFVMFDDISMRKNAENALRATQDRLQYLVNASPAVIYTCRPSGDYGATFMSENIGALMGYEPREFTEDSGFWADHIHPEDAPGVFAGLHRIFESPHYSHEYRFRNREGAWRWVQDDLHLIRDTAGEPLEMVGAWTDITERKQIEDKLREEHNWFEHILRITKTGFDVIDDEFNLQFVDKVWQQVYGDPAGRKCYEYFNGFTHPCPNCGIPRALETKQVIVTEEVLTRENNRIIEVHTMPFQHESGRWMVVEFNLDISNRKRTEEVLANAQKLEALGALAGGIAHDFNNLMGGIFGYVEMAGGASTEANVKQDLAKVMQTIDRARALTQQLLTFAKGGSPIQEVSPLFPFVQQTAQFALSGSNVSCRFDIADGLWSADYDKNQIGQVIDNLVINAQQAMPLGGTIILSARNVTLADNEYPILKMGDYIKLSVTDTGIGIPKELQKRIFDPFFTTKTKGHGLGLATSYSIIKRHGGCIDVYSEPGKGSTFNVYLPAARETASSSNYVHMEEHKGSGTFLVMDDQEVVREIISTILKTFGYEVVCTENGQNAIDHVVAALREKRTFAGMLFDLTVPGAMGGKEAIKQIRKMGVDIPAFVASGYADDPIIKNPTEYGFTASICKPFIRSELMEMLEKHMKRKE
jgi:PAS domain S-box-containing protein